MLCSVIISNYLFCKVSTEDQIKISFKDLFSFKSYNNMTVTHFKTLFD